MLSFWRSDSIEWVSFKERSREASMLSISTSLAKERIAGSRGLVAILRPGSGQHHSNDRNVLLKTYHAG